MHPPELNTQDSSVPHNDTLLTFSKPIRFFIFHSSPMHTRCNFVLRILCCYVCMCSFALSATLACLCASLTFFLSVMRYLPLHQNYISPLYAACRKGQAEVVSLLLQHNADIHRAHKVRRIACKTQSHDLVFGCFHLTCSLSHLVPQGMS